MATDIERVINLLQARHRGISVPGMTITAPDIEKYPGQINTTNLPYILAWPAAGSWYQKGGGFKLDSRTFRVFGFVQPLGQNDPPSRLIQAVRLLAAVRNHWATAANLALGDPGTEGGYQYTVESRDGDAQTDDGITVDLTWAGAVYLGFEVKLRVRTQWVG